MPRARSRAVTCAGSSLALRAALAVHYADGRALPPQLERLLFSYGEPVMLEKPHLVRCAKMVLLRLQFGKVVR